MSVCVKSDVSPSDCDWSIWHACLNLLFMEIEGEGSREMYVEKVGSCIYWHLLFNFDIYFVWESNPVDHTSSEAALPLLKIFSLECFSLYGKGKLIWLRKTYYLYRHIYTSISRKKENLIQQLNMDGYHRPIASAEVARWSRAWGGIVLSLQLTRRFFLFFVFLL